jgi:hypothetical protein
MNHDKTYQFFIKRLKKKRSELKDLHSQKIQALSISQEKELFMKITECESKIEELLEMFDYFGMHPKPVKYLE